MNFSERVATFLKSLSGSDKMEDEKKKATEQKAAEENNTDGEQMDKSEMADATEILSALVGELKGISDSLAALISKQDNMEKSQVDLGESIVMVSEILSKIGDMPVPPKSTMTKGNLGGAQTQSAVLTAAEFESAQRALTKSCKEKNMSIMQCSRLESEMQKALAIPGYKMRPEDISAVAQALKTA